jgi:PAS domain S-box-containing protein
MLGYSKTEDLLGKNLHNLIHHTRPGGSPYPVEQCHILVALWHHDATHIDDEVIWRADGTAFPAEYWSHPIWKGKQAIGSVAPFVDITERKRAAQWTCLLTRAIEISRELIGIADAQGRLIYANPAFQEALGFSKEEILEKPFTDLVSVNNPPAILEEIRTKSSSEGGWRGDCLAPRKDGTDLPISLSSSQITEAPGHAAA